MIALVVFHAVGGQRAKKGPFVTNFVYIKTHLYREVHNETQIFGPQHQRNGRYLRILNRFLGGVFFEVGPLWESADV